MPKGSGYPGQTKTGFLRGPGHRKTHEQGGSKDGTGGGQKKTGHLDGPGGGGIARPSGKDGVSGAQTSTGTTYGSGANRKKGQGESNPARTDEISEISN